MRFVHFLLLALVMEGQWPPALVSCAETLGHPVRQSEPIEGDIEDEGTEDLTTTPEGFEGDPVDEQSEVNGQPKLDDCLKDPKKGCEYVNYEDRAVWDRVYMDTIDAAKGSGSDKSENKDTSINKEFDAYQDEFRLPWIKVQPQYRNIVHNMSQFLLSLALIMCIFLVLIIVPTIIMHISALGYKGHNQDPNAPKLVRMGRVFLGFLVYCLLAISYQVFALRAQYMVPALPDAPVLIS